MTDMLVRDVDPELLQRLKDRAAPSKRSLQREVKAILEDAATLATLEEAVRRAEELRSNFGEKTFPDSAEPLREDRAR